MNVYDPMEIVITPETTYILIEHIHDSARIFTDGRDLPEDVEPTFAGYSIGKWIDTDGDGRYDTLEVETRDMRARAPSTPAACRCTRQPDHRQGAHLPRQGRSQHPHQRDHDHRQCADAAVDGDQEISARRSQQPVWPEAVCAEGNVHVEIGGQNYILSADGYPDASHEGSGAAGPANISSSHRDEARERTNEIAR